MKIRMRETREGSPDGVCVLVYCKGETYDVPEELAETFIREGWAESILRSWPAVSAAKDFGGAPENKKAKLKAGSGFRAQGSKSNPEPRTRKSKLGTLDLIVWP